jgi:hypothetical protein
MATVSSSNPDPDTEGENITADSSSEGGGGGGGGYNGPHVCLLKFAGDAAAGAVMGSIFGFGSFIKQFVSSGLTTVEFIFVDVSNPYLDSSTNCCEDESR